MLDDVRDGGNRADSGQAGGKREIGSESSAL